MPESGGLAMARAFEMPEPGASTLVFDRDGVRITAFAVDHRPVVPAVGYRVEFAGRSVVVSGDTAPSPNLAAQARGADLLVHEALSFDLMRRVSEIVGEAGQPRLSKLAADVLDYHTSPAQAKAMADEAGVRLLVLTHNVPPLRNALIERMFAEGLDQGGVVIGDDGMHFVLEPGGTGIDRDRF
jgi:ribonuclease Z